MKKANIKQILAICAIVLLVALYISTLVFALSGNPNWMNMLMAAVVSTILIPIMLWAGIKTHEAFRKWHKKNPQ